jgi:hypothetical protein
MTTAEPWAAFGWEAPGLLPGHVAQLRRLEAAEAAQERREADERQARAEDRRDLAIHQRMQEFAFAGRPFDPADPSTLAYAPGELAEKVFAHQDVENAHEERKALVDAGILHLLDGPGVYPTTSPSAPGPGASPAAPTATARATPLGARIRGALDRWATRSTGGHTSGTCRCAACDPAAPPGDVAAGLPELVRYVDDTGLRIR